MQRACEITHVYGAEEAREVVRRSHEDYMDKYKEVAQLMSDVYGDECRRQ